MDEDLRQHFRIPGPFDGFRIGLLQTPVRIYDLSEGGCFVSALYACKPGETLTLKIELPHEGWIILKGEALYNREEFGFAVRFTEMSDHVREALVNIVNKTRRRLRLAG